MVNQKDGNLIPAYGVGQGWDIENGARLFLKTNVVKVLSS